MTSFTSRLVNQEGGLIRFITTREKDIACWCYLKIDPHKFPDYKKALRQEVMNIREFGQVLRTGWGKYPPQEVIDFMKDTYGFDTPTIGE